MKKSAFQPIWAHLLAEAKEQSRKKIAHLNSKVHNFSPLAVRFFKGPAAVSSHFTQRVRIAHLTDQHIGLVTPMHIQLEAVEKTNEHNPDLVLLTGDFVCHSQLYLADLQEVVSKFKAPVFAVLGNHDHWAGANAVAQALRQSGAELLCNANTIVEIKGQQIQLVGLDDAYTHHADYQKAIKGLKNNVASIGLSHIAEEADKLWDAQIPLVLSGHTHGGQITVAGLHEIMLKRVIKHRYVHGLYEDTGSVYVGAGIGSAVMPVRLGEFGRREIVFFDF